MLESIRGLSGWCCNDYRAIYRFWRRMIMKQDELNYDLKFTKVVGFGGKSLSYWKKKTILKMKSSMWESQKPHIGIWCWIDEF